MTQAVSGEHHGYATIEIDRAVTLPNLITLIRTAGSVALASASITTGSTRLLFAALLVHWVGDLLDGAAARALRRETRSGAVLDIVCDRLCVGMYYILYCTMHKSLILPIMLFLFEFMVIDNYLSLAFVNWPLLSPNYFHVVDRIIYGLNWTRLGKAANSGVFAVLAIVSGSALVCTVYVSGLMGVKIYSIVRLHRLPR